MAKANLFCINPDAKIDSKVRGQARIVLNELERDTTPRLGVDIDREICAREPYKTRQDTLRVTLYYLVIFAGRGWVLKAKPIEAVAETPAETPVDDEVLEGDEVETDNEDVEEPVEA